MLSIKQLTTNRIIRKSFLKNLCIYILKFGTIFYLCFILLQNFNKRQLKVLFDGLQADVSYQPRFNMKGYYYSTLQTSQINRVKAEINTRSTIPSSRLISGNSSNLAPLLLVVVCSHPSHVHNRLTIRNTWAFNLSRQVRVVFLIGESEDGSWKSVIRREAMLHKDIIQLDIIETYTNLTIKMLAGFKQILKKFTSCKYILKTDDDTYINLPYLLYELSENSQFVKRNQILGALCINSPVVRDVRDVWSVTRDIFQNKTYPPYVHGGAYLLQYSTLQTLLSQSVSTPILHLEDVYITGILSQYSGVQPVSHSGFSFWNSKPVSVCDIVNNRIISSVNLKVKQIIRLYNGVQRNSVNGCH